MKIYLVLEDAGADGMFYRAIKKTRKEAEEVVDLEKNSSWPREFEIFEVDL